jgi:hypothetical protein
MNKQKFLFLLATRNFYARRQSESQTRVTHQFVLLQATGNCWLSYNVGILQV